MSLEFDLVRSCESFARRSLKLEAQIRGIAGSAFPANSKVSGCAMGLSGHGHFLLDALRKTTSNREVDPAVRRLVIWPLAS